MKDSHANDMSLEKWTEFTKEMVDHGQLIESGFIAYRLAVIPSNAPQVQIDETRKAFMVGAMHVFSSLITVLDTGSEPTAEDIRRFESIGSELEQFAKTLDRKTYRH